MQRPFFLVTITAGISKGKALKENGNIFCAVCLQIIAKKKAGIMACATEMMQSFVFRLEMVRLQGHINSALNVLTRCHKTWS